MAEKIFNLLQRLNQVQQKISYDQLEKDLDLKEDFDLVYDQVVSKGELISSIIVYNYLVQLQLPAYWLDATLKSITAVV